jgi:hypothetical protein
MEVLLMNRLMTTLLWTCPTVVVAASLGAWRPDGATPPSNRPAAAPQSSPPAMEPGTLQPEDLVPPTSPPPNADMADMAATMARHGLPTSGTDAWRHRCPMPCNWHAVFTGRP